MKKVYNKLVRDKIPQICRDDNHIPQYKVINQARFKKELKKKLTGGIVTKIIQPSALKIIISVKQGNSLYNLLMSAESERPRIYITEEKYTDKIPSLNFSLSLKNLKIPRPKKQPT